jgi:Calx-beta domain/Divergent InlB B-repeat domain/Bacterial Ig domain
MKFPSQTRVLALVTLWFLTVGLLCADAAQSLRFSAATYRATESSGTARITVTRGGGSAGTITGDFATVDMGGGTATAEADYAPTSGTLTFGPGVTSQSFLVPILNDIVHEGSETVLLTLFFNDAFLEATLTITDNDACVFTVSTNRVFLAAAGGVAESAIEVTNTEGCDWNAVNTTADATWLGISKTITSVISGTVSLSFDTHSGPTARSAKLLVAGKTVTVTQLPFPPPDTTTPTVTIRLPAANARQTNDTILVTGTASDDVAVTLVEARLENDAEFSDYIIATGTTEWSVPLAGLIPGTNTIRVRARDAASHVVESTRQVIYVEVSPLTLTTNGTGSITGVRNGMLLDVGKTYTARAATDRAHLFTGWTGSIETTVNPITFTMHTGFVLAANFVINPYIAVAGTYSGLCHETGTNRHESSGYLTLKCNDLGAFSAKLLLGGARHSFSGQFTRDGHVTNTLTRSILSNLTVTLHIDLVGGSDQISGNITDGRWTSTVLVDRAVFSKSSPATQAGRYTVIIPGDDEDAEAQPGGASFGIVTVSSNGAVKLSASLADGTRLSQSAPLSKNGYWPLYASLYGGKGSAISWVVFAESEESDFAGSFSWFKPALPTAKYYPAGFGVDLNLSGSRYTAPTNSTDPILNFPAGRVQFSAGNLEEFENLVSLSENKVTNLGTNKLTLSINKSSGLFSGSVLPPGARASLPFKGAIDKNLNQGWGFFLGTNQSGRVRLSE